MDTTKVLVLIDRLKEIANTTPMRTNTKGLVNVYELASISDQLRELLLPKPKPERTKSYDNLEPDEVECPTCDGYGDFGTPWHSCGECHGLGTVERES